MLDAIDDVLRRTGGVATRARLLTVVTRNQFDHETRSGQLVSPFARAWCRPWDADTLLDRAALTSVGPPAALSHMTALRRWGLLDADPDAPVHVSVPVLRNPRGQPGLVVHRVARLPQVARLDGLPTVLPAPAAVSSWPLLPAGARRAPLITAVRTGVTSAEQLRAAADGAPRLRGRAELFELIQLLAQGCESELEIWGFLHVFDVPGLRHGKRQPWVKANGHWYRLDLAYFEERVIVEMDGWGAHSSKQRRERDTQRDAALAALGWLTLRFSFYRLHHDVDGCRRDTLATLAARRR